MRDWPQEIAKPHQYGNFRDPSKRYPTKAQKAAKRELRDGNSIAHLNLLRMMPCAVCHEMKGIHPHHLRSLDAAKERGVGRKATDRHAVPLCFDHHLGCDGVHSVGSRQEVAWFRDSYGVDAHNLAACLWSVTGDLGRMNRVLLAHKLAASRELVSRKR